MQRAKSGLLGWFAGGHRSMPPDEKLLELLEHAPVAVAMFEGEKHRCIFANAMYDVLVEHRPILGRRLAEALPELAGSRVLVEMDRILESGTPGAELEVSAQVDLDGTGIRDQRYYQVMVKPWFAAEEKMGGVVCYAVDVTPQATARESAFRFLAVLGHELRNPLAPLKSCITALADRPGEQELMKRTLPIMKRQLDHVVRLVDDLLDLARISRGIVGVESRPTELSDAVDAAVEQVMPMVVARRHDLRLMEACEKLQVHGDSARLTEVFANLLSNAARYTDVGGTIDIAISREGDQAVVSVRDNGIGMPPEELDNAFGLFKRLKFRQSRDGRDEGYGGLGIGLALAREIVERHNGTIEAHSDGPGQGSEFIVRLPLIAR